MEYTVIKPFTYAGRAFERGQAWEPAGYRVDRQLVTARYVAVVEAAPAPEPKRAPGRPRKEP